MPNWTHRKGNYRRNGRASMASAIHLPLEQQARKVRFLLQELGLEHACFGLYLSSRIDLLPAEYCRELAHIPQSATPLPAQEVHRILVQELGKHESVLAQFDYTPFESTLISQSHHAQLVTGAPAVIVVLHPQYYQAQDQQHVSSLLQTDLINEHCGRLLTADVFADFGAALQRKTNLALAREGMELMARDAASFELLGPHKTYPELSTTRLLTFEQQDGQTLDQVLRGQLRHGDVLARRLCQVWLQQALHGSCFPADAQLADVFAGKDNQISFIHSDLVGLPHGAKENLRNYFSAMFSDDPDKAAAYLLREMTPAQRGTIDGDKFRSSFRQAAYFGMLEPVLGTDSNALAQIAFQHWKTAIEHGYTAKMHLLCFYRGLFSIARIARQLSTAGDPLREGMEEFRSNKAIDELRGILDLRYWFENSDKFASALVQLPRVFDEALTKGSTVTPEGEENPAGAGRGRNASATNYMFLVLLAIVISQMPVGQGWQGKVLPVALMLAGLLVLRESK